MIVVVVVVVVVVVAFSFCASGAPNSLFKDMTRSTAYLGDLLSCQGDIK